jgi:C1A family cysteine protease
MKATIFTVLLIIGLFFLVKCGDVKSPDTFTIKQYEKKHALGLKRDWEKHKKFLAKYKTERAKLKDTLVPASFDMSARVSPPEDQGNCGSCWAFALTKALRSAWMLGQKDPGTLAFNYLVNNCGPGPKQFGCNGGDFDAGESFLNGSGPWLESKDPYHESDGGRCLGLPPAATALTFKTVGDGNTAPSFKDDATALSQNHMLVVDVAICGAWENYSSGIFNKNQCDANSINHMINLVGYNCETSVDKAGNCVFDAKGEPVNGDGYLIAMNNWGTSWGEKGYMRTRAHMDAIGTTVMYFEVDAPVVPVEPVKFSLDNKKWQLDVVLELGNKTTKEEAVALTQTYLDTLE